MDGFASLSLGTRHYDYWHEGEAFSYAIPVPDNRGRVTIHTFEPNLEVDASLSMTANLG